MIADHFRPNLSTREPVSGVVTAPVRNPSAYSDATEKPYPSYSTYRCVPEDSIQSHKGRMKKLNEITLW